MEPLEASEEVAVSSARPGTIGGENSVEIDIEQAAGGAVVRVAGDVDMVSSPELREAVLELLVDKQGTVVVVNLAGVKYIDSSGVASLIEGLKEARRVRRSLRLACLNDGPRHVLELTRLLDLFDVYATEADALDS